MISTDCLFFRSERLPSLKPKRDLTLGGVKKVSSVTRREREREGEYIRRKRGIEGGGDRGRLVEQLGQDYEVHFIIIIIILSLKFLFYYFPRKYSSPQFLP